MMAKFSEKIDIKPGESKQRNYSIQIPQIAPTYKNEENGIEVRNYIRVCLFDLAFLKLLQNFSTNLKKFIFFLILKKVIFLKFIYRM